jgi:hypothetical protein
MPVKAMRIISLFRYMVRFACASFSLNIYNQNVMAKKKLTVSQERLKRRLEDLINNPDFQQDVKSWRDGRHNGYAEVTGYTRIYKKYKLPDSATRFLIEYLNYNETDYSLLSPPAFLVGDKGYIELEDGHTHHASIVIGAENGYREYIEQNYLKLYISPNATINELKDYLAKNKEEIKAMQQKKLGSEQKRVRTRLQSVRDNYIMRLHADGKTSTEIEKELKWNESYEGNLNSSDIVKIIKKMTVRKAKETDT